MKRNELIELRSLVKNEIKRRERIQELLKNELVIEYLKVTKTKPVNLDSNNIKEIISKVLSSFTITKTNGIYVCTSAWYTDYEICYEETNYYSKDVDINSEYAESKIYTDIESGECISAKRVANSMDIRPLISNFERDNIVLNPYNTGNNRNGYDEVKLDFFETALKAGQAKAKKLVLNKYPRI